MKFYAYDICVRNKALPLNELTPKEQEGGIIPTVLEREVNRIYSSPYEEVVSMTITPLCLDKELPTLATHYHIVYVTKSKI